MSDARTTAPCARCGHQREAHEHYRRGADCGLCGCEAFVDRRATGYARESGKVARLVDGLVRLLRRSGR
ncbi:hypothetical protein [Streptomyces sp. NP160]|uniref:hypothetical protein n=1 Tax=Streptomyces sp. NP160 TaxID=2586637 RepID=UPI0015D58631|nr:hypothetical protein [Streptomyces sp. NP160]